MLSVITVQVYQCDTMLSVSTVQVYHHFTGTCCLQSQCTQLRLLMESYISLTCFPTLIFFVNIPLLSYYHPFSIPQSFYTSIPSPPSSLSTSLTTTLIFAFTFSLHAIYSSTLMMEAAISCKILTYFYQFAGCHIPETQLFFMSCIFSYLFNYQTKVKIYSFRAAGYAGNKNDNLL